MPVPLAPLLPLVLRIGSVAAIGLAARRAVVTRLHPGRTDQRAEDALDDLGDGIAVHRPRDRAEDRQTNTAARFRRVVRVGKQSFELDAGLLARFRLRKLPE